MSNEEPKHLYRFADRYDRNESSLLLMAFPVLRTTPKGFWIGQGAFASWAFPAEQMEKFVLRADGKRKRFAYADKQDALHSYKVRKLWQTSRLRAQLDRAEKLRLAAEGEFEEPFIWSSGHHETWTFKAKEEPFSLFGVA